MTKQDPFHIRACQNRGRYLVAAERFAVGQTIVSGLPIARALSTSNISSRCHSCWSLLQNALRCSSCQFARYCSGKCQKASWLQHKHECAVIKRVCIPRQVQPTPSLLVLFNTVLRQPSDPLSSMASNWDSLSDTRKSQFMQMAVLLNEMLGAVRDFHHAHSLASLAELFARHHVNSFTITDSEMQPIGIGIYPYPIHLINHSCRPNAVVVFERSTSEAIVKVIQAVNPNEEIAISYCDAIREKAVRQAELREQYCFDCSCISCQGQENTAGLRSAVKLQDRFLELLDAEDYDAAEQCLSSIPADKIYDCAPIQLGLHYLKLGKLRLFLNRPKASVCLDRAVEILYKLLEPNDPILIEANQLYQEASQQDRY